MLPKGWLLFPILMLAAQPAAASPLDEPCLIEWRNTPLKQAMEELTGRYNLPVLLDESVTPEMAETPIRLFTRHLTGKQALHWLARWAGLEAVIVDDSLLIAQPERLPRIWREEIALGAASQPAPDAAWQAVRSRSTDVNWTDAPLSLVTRDVSNRFGIDMIVQADILKSGNMVNLQQTGATLAQVCDVIAGQLDAAIDLVDGALWVHSRILATSRPSTQSVQAPASPTPSPIAAMDVLFTRQVTLDPAAPDWPTFAKLLTTGINVDCRVEVPPGAKGPDFTARGTAREILEASKLLGRLDYRLEPSGTGPLPVLFIRVR